MTIIARCAVVTVSVGDGGVLNVSQDTKSKEGFVVVVLVGTTLIVMSTG